MISNKKRVRLTPAVRKEQILKAGIKLAESIGYESVTRTRLSKKIKLSVGIISYYYGTMSDLRNAIVRYAIEHESLPVVAQALIRKHPQISRCSNHLREQAIKSLSK